MDGWDPKVPVKVFFSPDYLSMGSSDSFQGGCETLTLEHFEKSKMAAKMASPTKKSTTTPINTPTKACSTSKKGFLSMLSSQM